MAGDPYGRAISDHHRGQRDVPLFARDGEERDDPSTGLAYRVFHLEYDGDVSKTLLFRLFSPDQLREATVETGWEVAEISRGSGEDDHYYRAALIKR